MGYSEKNALTGSTIFDEIHISTTMAWNIVKTVAGDENVSFGIDIYEEEIVSLKSGSVKISANYNVADLQLSQFDTLCFEIIN